MVVLTECENMFWGVTLDTGKRYSQVVKQGFHVSMAALEVHAKKPSENVQIMLQHESSEYLLCTLHTNLLQQPLDLNFAPGEQVSFSLNGSGVVHLTGYLIPEEEEPDFDESFSESDEEDVPSLVEPSDNGKIKLGAKRKAILSSQTSKKLKLSDSINDDDDSDEDDEDYSEEDEEDFSEEEEGFSDDFDDDEFDEEDDDDELSPEKKDNTKTPTKLAKPETPALQKNKQSLNIQGQKDKSVKNVDKTPKQDGKGSKSPKQTVETPKQVDKAETPSSATDESGKKKKKKKKKKNKEGDSSQNESTTSTPGTTPKAESTPKKRVVAGGTVVEDLKVGHGPEAKPGKMASVYYVGTLAKNNKRFDSCTEGKPFRFRLNQGEVIKGWDNGVLGMKVGGKRRITVPANQGYGSAKQGPIPPNSSLVFEVELKAVS